MCFLIGLFFTKFCSTQIRLFKSFSCCCCSLLLFILTIRFISGYFFFNYLLTFLKKMCKWEIKSVGIRKKTVSAAYERRVLVLSDDYQFTVEVCANDPSIWTPNVLRSSCGERGLIEKQAETTSELGVACRSQIIDSNRYRGSGHRSCTCTVNPQNFFLFCFVSRSTFHEFPFFSFFYSPL